ncbi:MAG: hypothetical protein ACREO0_12175 [Pseudoxanthomonas sp.]
MSLRRIALLFLAVCLSAPAWATTWGETTVVDPIGGKPCKVATPASMGSYVYEWPEKYDQVFFPVTASQGIWTCSASGFVSVIGDIALSVGEKQRIAAYLAGLAAAERNPKDIAGKLDRAEALYLLRDLDPGRRALIHRILAYDFESMAANATKAADHRKAALQIMLDRLADPSLADATRLEYLFVCANYLRETGNAARADRLVSQLETLIADSAGSPAEAYAHYLQSLLASAKTIAPGGRLAPEPQAVH